MTGSLFVSLYFDDMVRILAESAVGPDVGSVLIGSRGQTMSATSGFVYDDMFLDPLRSSIAFGMTADVVERELMALNPVSFWTVDGLDVRYYTAVPIADTAWDAVCVTSFWDAYTKVMAALAPLIAAGLAIVAGVFLLLEKSVEELQRKVYDDGRSAEADIADILELTSSGLADGLTGTVTRSVFSSKLASSLENARDSGSLYVLCFIDLDDFKTINDTYGHATGDAALKSIGYALRGYEHRRRRRAARRARRDGGRPSCGHPGGRSGGLGALQHRRGRVGPGFRRRCAFGAGRQRSVSRQAAW